ncbi:trace amine-associated receptor 1-like [Montipora capricornis]|uniref:trace amine-associated receptor 1-like n=1 Tax=Montipora capricornis TaxID=246305 RepID=UPI0035F10791
MYAKNGSNTTATNEKIEQDLEALPQLIPIGILVILTNSLVFLLFYKRKHLRKAANYLLFSLAVCDFLNGSLNIILFVMAFLPVVEGATYFILVCAVEVSHNFVAITEACHIILITAEKYIAVMRPLKYHVIKTRTILLAIAGAWLISGLIAASPIGWFSPRLSRIKIGLTLEFIFNVFCVVVVFIVPNTFITFAHVTMFRKVLQKSRRRNILYRPNSGKVCTTKRTEIKCLVIFATMATVFALCWLPWFTLRLVYSMIGQRWIKPNYDVLETAAHVTVILRYLASAINPLLYTFFKQDFWRALKRMVFIKSTKDSRRLKTSSTNSRYKRRSIKNNRSDCVMNNRQQPP